MATFTFEDKTSFELENGEEVIYSWTTKVGVGGIRKKSYPTGFVTWLLNLVTLKIYGSIKTRQWLVHIALTNKRFVAVPIDYETYRNASKEVKFGGMANLFNKAPKVMFTESYHYSDIKSAEYLKEESQADAMLQARFGINLKNPAGFAHEFEITTKKSGKQVGKILSTALKEADAKSNEIVVDILKGWSKDRHQASYDNGSVSFNEAQAAYDKDAEFWNSFKEGVKKMDLSSEDHIQLCSYIIALINACVKKG